MPGGACASHPGRGGTTAIALADPECAPTIVALLGARLGEAPFKYAGAPAPRLLLRIRALDVDVDVRLDFWVALGRVDVALGDCFFVFTRIAEALLLPGVEVLFRRPTRAAFSL